MFDVHFIQSILGKNNSALRGYMGLPLKNSGDKRNSSIKRGMRKSLLPRNCILR
jgi:hypothetical protein